MIDHFSNWNRCTGECWQLLKLSCRGEHNPMLMRAHALVPVKGSPERQVTLYTYNMERHRTADLYLREHSGRDAGERYEGQEKKPRRLIEKLIRSHEAHVLSKGNCETPFPSILLLSSICCISIQITLMHRRLEVLTWIHPAHYRGHREKRLQLQLLPSKSSRRFLQTHISSLSAWLHQSVLRGTLPPPSSFLLLDLKPQKLRPQVRGYKTHSAATP